MDNQETSSGKFRTGKVILISLVAALGGFLFGYDSGVINGTVGALQDAFDSDEVGTGFNVASMLLGCAAGAFFAGSISDRIGRRGALLIAAAAFTISAFGSGIADNSAQFVFFRILGGLAVGGASVIAPAYISEIAPASIRGRLTTLQQMMIVLGLFSSFTVNYFIVNFAGGASVVHWLGFDAWRWMFWMELIPATLFFVLLFFIPESPRYLVAAGQYDRAESILNNLIPWEPAKAKVQEIQETLERRPSLRDIINRATNKIYPIVWIGIGIAILQQFTGINIVFYYGETLWTAAGFELESALVTNILTGGVNIVFTIVAIILMDKVGRRTLLLVGALGQAVALGLLAILFGMAGVDAEGNLALSQTEAAFSLIFANGFVAFFAVTWGPVMWVLFGEMFPNQFRGAALAVAGLIHWIANFSVTMTFPIFLEHIGLGFSYAIYAGFGVVAFFFVKAFIKETKGHTLEEISHRNK